MSYPRNLDEQLDGSRAGGVPSTPRFPEIEDRVLRYWREDGTFVASVEQRPAGVDGSNEFVFYDGPPFANGLPHYGHLLTGYVKDVVPRYETMRGRRVERRFGWDCHGLPAEVEAEKQLGITHKSQIEDARRRRVQRRLPHLRAALHEGLGGVRRRGRPAGSTSSTTTRRSTSTTWRACSGRSRRSGTRGSSTRASASSPTAGAARRRCRTPRPGWTTSTGSARTRRSPSASSSRPAIGCSSGRRRRGPSRPTSPSPSVPTSSTSSSSPPTGPLPGAGSCSRRPDWRTTPASSASRPGSCAPCAAASWWGWRYRPPFDFFLGRAGAHRVLGADFVTTDDGTGVVHLAPAFGEDDKVATDAAGIEPVVPVDSQGRFTAEVAAVRRAAGVRGQPADRRRPEGRAAERRRPAPPGDLRPPLPALLALRQPAHLQGGLVVVREGERRSRTGWSS